MKLTTLSAAAAALALSLAMPAFAQDATESTTATPNDIASQNAMASDMLGVDVTTTGATDEERLAFFTAMSVEDQASMREKCTTYIDRDTETPNEVAEDAAMSFCNVVVAQPQ